MASLVLARLRTDTDQSVIFFFSLLHVLLIQIKYDLSLTTTFVLFAGQATERQPARSMSSTLSWYSSAIPGYSNLLRGG